MNVVRFAVPNTRLNLLFFTGLCMLAMRVGIAFAVATFIIARLLFDASLLITFMAIVATMIGFMPVIIRLSRNIWINIFFTYDAKAAKINSRACLKTMRID